MWGGREGGESGDAARDAARNARDARGQLVAEVRHGVEQRHVAPADAWVGDAVKECHLRNKHRRPNQRVGEVDGERHDEDGERGAVALSRGGGGAVARMGAPPNESGDGETGDETQRVARHEDREGAPPGGAARKQRREGDRAGRNEGGEESERRFGDAGFLQPQRSDLVDHDKGDFARKKHEEELPDGGETDDAPDLRERFAHRERLFFVRLRRRRRRGSIREKRRDLRGRSSAL